MSDSVFRYYEYSVKKYGKGGYKTAYIKRSIWSDEHSKKFEEEEVQNDSKLINSISRSKQKVYEYALCNDFDYFVTLTIDKKKYNRYDLKAYYKDLSQFIRDYRKKYGVKVEYLFIPELHKDGAWHIHGLIKGDIVDLTVNKNGYMDWVAYLKKFGYISLDLIRNKEACAAYITKYICKDVALSITQLGQHLYYASRGLEHAELVDKGITMAIQGDIQYDGDYCKISWSDDCPHIDCVDNHMPCSDIDWTADIDRDLEKEWKNSTYAEWEMMFNKAQGHNVGIPTEPNRPTAQSDTVYTQPTLFELG